MGLMDKIKSGLEKAKDEASDLAQTTRLRMEISGLNRRRTDLLHDIGERVIALHAAGKAPAELAAACDQVHAIEEQMKQKQSEIDRIVRDEEPASGPASTS